LGQRTLGVRGLPATDQAEVLSEAVEYVAFTAKDPDRFSFLPISDGDVEVPAQHKIGIAAKCRHTIQNMLHCADVTPFANRDVNAQHS
jgi:hypothetical protein